MAILCLLFQNGFDNQIIQTFIINLAWKLVGGIEAGVGKRGGRRNR